MKKGKNILFGILSISFAIAVFVIVDIMLSYIVGQHQTNQLFEDAMIEGDSTQSYYSINPNVWQAHFDGFNPAVDFKPFSPKKAVNEFRIAVLGGSSVAGFPYAFYNAFPAYLQQNLQLQFPEKTIRVFNFGATAIASGTVASHISSLKHLNADAVLIYMGHNEFFGANALLSQPTFLRAFPQSARYLSYLDHSFFFQVLKKAINSLSSGRSIAKVIAKSQMENAALSAGNYTVQVDSVYAVNQFLNNLEVIVDEIKSQNGATIWVSTLLSNKRAQPPLGKNELAMEAFTKAQQLDSISANVIEVADAYQQALNLDAAPFRALENFNKRLRIWVKDNAQNVELIDLEKELAQATYGPLPGSDFFADHLHFNEQGNLWVAGVMSQALSKKMDKWLVDSSINRDVDADIIMGLKRTDLLDRASAGLQLNALATIGPLSVSTYSDTLISDTVQAIALSMLTQNISFDQAYTQSLNYYRSFSNHKEYNLGLRPFIYWESVNKRGKWGTHLNSVWNSQKNSGTTSLIWPLLDHYSNQPSAQQATNIGASLLSLAQKKLGEHWLKTAIYLDKKTSRAYLQLSQYYLSEKDTLMSNGYFIRYQQSLQQ